MVRQGEEIAIMAASCLERLDLLPVAVPVVQLTVSPDCGVPSVVMICPIGSRDGASIRFPATDGAPASDCTVHPDCRIEEANHAAPATSSNDAAAVRICSAACARTCRRMGGRAGNGGSVPRCPYGLSNFSRRTISASGSPEPSHR